MTSLPYAYRNGGNATAALQSAFEVIDSREPAVNAWVAIQREAALSAAAALDDEAEQGRFRGPLHGLPLGVKDLFDVVGMRTQAGSRSRAGAQPAERDAPVVAELRAAGCVIVGKTHTTEYAFLDPTVTRNPFNLAHTPGGSSSGSGAAVGAGMVPLAIGTQTVGSVCRPAAYCGAAAFKPTTGTTNMAGVVPFASSYDTTGFLATRLEIAVDAWRAISALGANGASRASDASDAASVGHSVGLATLRGLRFAVPADSYFAELDAEVAKTLAQVAERLEQAGAVRLPLALDVDLSAMRGLQRTVMFHEAAHAHQGLFGDPAMFAELGPHWREGLLLGRSVSRESHRQALAKLAQISEAALRMTAGVDFLLLPAAKSTAPSCESTGDPGLILPWTIFGSPLSVLPVAIGERGLPTAVMLAGQPHQDARHASVALAVAALLRSEQ